MLINSLCKSITRLQQDIHNTFPNHLPANLLTKINLQDRNLPSLYEP